MATQITLGNISTQNGRTVIGGGQSGLDTDAIIKGLTEAKRLPAVKLETTNKNLSTQKTALSSLQSLLTRFRTAVDTLRNPPGVLNASQNIFQYRTATLSSIAGASNYMDVTVEPGANIQNLTVNEITAIARETKQETGIISVASASANAVKASGDATTGQFSAGTFSMRVLDGGAAANITLAENDSLNTIASKFNAVKDRTGVQATVVKVANGTPNSDFKIIFTGTKTGLTGAFDLANSGTILTDTDGVLADVTSHVDFATTQSATNAVFKLDGATITRESNVVSDLIDGISFTLKQPITNTTPITISVQPDTTIVTNALNAFADVYNELRVFQAKQSEVGEDGLPTETAVLSNNSALRAITSAVAAEITNVVAGLTNGDPASLSEIGFKFQDFAGDDENPATRNIIVIDADKMKTALSGNFEAVRNIFEFRMTADNENLGIYSRSNSLSVNEFTLTLDRANNVYTANYSGGSATFDYTEGVDGAVTLKGKSGTPFEGLTFIYASATDATINVKMTQGIGDRLYNELDKALATNGSVPNALTTIEAQKTRNETEITKIDTYIERYRDQLLDIYSRLEASMSKANQLLSLLGAQADARNNQ